MIITAARVISTLLHNLSGLRNPVQIDLCRNQLAALQAALHGVFLQKPHQLCMLLAGRILLSGDEHLTVTWTTNIADVNESILLV